MQTLETIFARRSIRAYQGTPIPAQDLQQILEAGRQAPSAANRQPWHFVVVTEPAQRKALADACNGQMWMADAGCIVVALGSPQISPKWYKVDVAIALEHIVLAAHSLGYGTCWIGAFDPAVAREVLGIPDNVTLIAFTPLGYTTVQATAKRRKPLAELVSYEHW